MILGVPRIVESSATFPESWIVPIAERLGFSVRVPMLQFEGDVLKNGKWGVEELEQIVETADVLYLVSNGYLQQEPQWVRRLQQRLIAGHAHLIAQPNPFGRFNGEARVMDWWNSFLAPFEIVLSEIRIAANGVTSNVPFSCSEGSLRDPTLFAGVDRVCVNQPYALWHGGDSIPLLVGQSDHFCFDGFKDLPSEWNGRELACIAVWHSADGGSVTVIAGDPFAGIDVQLADDRGNSRFTHNLLKSLASRCWEVTPYCRLQRTETNLADVVIETLKRNSQGDWWRELVPEDIRNKCETRQRDEGMRMCPEAYLELIEYSKLMKANWPLFEPIIRSAGWEGGKNKALSWLNRLNELRKLVCHPTKSHLSGTSLCSGDIAYLRDCDERTLRLWKIRRGADLS